MTQSRLQTLTRAELLDELGLFGHPVESSELEALIASDLVPFIDGDGGDVFPLFTIVQVVDAIGGGHGGTVEELRARAQMFADAIDGVADGLADSVGEIRRVLTNRAVLGELHRMLPVLELAALESLRGDARFEWRMRMCLGELQELLEQDSIREGAMTPILASDVADAREVAQRRGTRRARVTSRSGAAIVPGLLPVPTNPRIAPGAPPYWPNGAPDSDSDEERQSAAPSSVRMPFLAERLEENSDAGLPKPITAAFPSAPDMGDAREVTEPFVSGNATPRQVVTDAAGWDDDDLLETAPQGDRSASGDSPIPIVPNVADEPFRRRFDAKAKASPTPEPGDGGWEGAREPEASDTVNEVAAVTSAVAAVEEQAAALRDSVFADVVPTSEDSKTGRLAATGGLGGDSSRATDGAGAPTPRNDLPKVVSTVFEATAARSQSATGAERDDDAHDATPTPSEVLADSFANEPDDAPRAEAVTPTDEAAIAVGDQPRTDPHDVEEPTPAEQAKAADEGDESARTEDGAGADTSSHDDEVAASDEDENAAAEEVAAAAEEVATDVATEVDPVELAGFRTSTDDEYEDEDLLESFEALFDSESGEFPQVRADAANLLQTGDHGTATKGRSHAEFERRITSTGELPSVDPSPRRMATGGQCGTRITKEVDTLTPATAASKAREEAVARSRSPRETGPRRTISLTPTAAMAGRFPGAPATGLSRSDYSPLEVRQSPQTAQLSPLLGRGGVAPSSSSMGRENDSVTEFLAAGFSAPPTSDPRPTQREEQTDLHMATVASSSEPPGRLTRHTDTLLETVGLRPAKSTSESRAQLPLRRRAATSSVDMNAVMADPHAAFDRSAARLEANGDDSQAQDELVAIVGGNDRILARKAWAVVAPILRERRARTDALFGGLVMMAARDPDPSLRVRHLREAAGVAESVLGDHKRALELITDAIALSPNEALLQERAGTIAEAFGWWPEYVERVSRSAINAGDTDLRVTLTKLAGRTAKNKLNDTEKAIELYEGVVADGVYDEDIVAELVDLYARDGRGSDTLVLLLRCAEIADGEERIARLTRAADLCVEELNDLDGALGIYESALAKGDTSNEVRARYIGLARRSGQGPRALVHLAKHVEDPFANAMLRADIARDDFEDAGLEIDARSEAFALSGGQEKLRAGFTLADSLRKNGQHAGEIRTLEDMLAHVGPGDRRVSVVRRLAGVLAAQDGGKAQAIELYTESIRAGEFDEKLVHAVGSLLRTDGRFDEWIETLSLAAQKSGEGESRQGYYRHVARVASELIEDDEHALNLIEQTVDASQGDPQVLLAMATRSRRAGDVLSEMAALEQAVHSDAVTVGPTVLMRLAELELARPRGAARAAELVERVLELEPLSHGVGPDLSRVLRIVAEETGRRDLDLRWSWMQTEEERSPEDAHVLWAHIVALQEALGDDIERRQHAVDAAMAAASDVNADSSDVAALELSAARVKRAMGHWNVAVEHASNAARHYLALAPRGVETLEAVATIAELTQYVMDERPPLRLLRQAAETGVPPLMAAYAEALMHKSRWHDAMPILEELVDGTSDPEMLERLRGELARARSEVAL